RAAASKLPFHSGLNLTRFRFLRGRARKILVRPDKPMSYALILREQCVRSLHRGCSICPLGTKNYHRTWLRVSSPLQSDHDAIAHFRLPVQCTLQIFGIHIHPRRSDNHIFLAALEIEVTRRVEFTNVAGAVPALI